MSRRLPGATESERLTMATVKDEDQLTTRHNPGTLDDVDLGLSKAILQSEPVCVCTSAAQTIAKTASLSSESFPDFKLINGRKVIVYMANANTASSPTLNVANTGAIPLEGDYWEAGTFLYLQYVDITVSGSRIQRWLVDQGAKNTKSQLNGALTNALTSVLKKQTLSFSYNIPASGDTIFTFNHPNNYQLLQMLVSDVSLPDAGIIGNPIKNGNTYTVRMLNAGSLAFHGILSVELIWCPTSYLSPL